MQPKVSVVIACYNKEKYIEELLDSILSQSWKNIQLIIVNDGSTDNTREYILSYKPRFLENHIEFVFIDQENTGVSIAVRNGLKKANGEYVCMPDADDVLYSDYIRNMVDIMAHDSGIQWVVCDSDRTRWTQCIEEYKDAPCDSDCFEDLLERFILMCNYGMVWQLMIRTSYLKETDIIGSLGLFEWTTTHEAQVWIPVIAGGGKGRYLPQRLYRFRDGDASLSDPGTAEKVLAYARYYRESVERVLYFCNIKDEKYRFLAMLREYQEIFTHEPNLKEFACRKLSEVLIGGRHIDRPLDPNMFYDGSLNPCYSFNYWLWRRFVPQFLGYPKGNVIAYGALGKRAVGMLPAFNATNWKPVKLWDINGEGKIVTKPDFGSLKKGDTLLIFPKDEKIINDTRKQINDEEVDVYFGGELNLLLSRAQQLPIETFFPRWCISYDYRIIG